jgi:pyruvate/2-oxoglutarate dehydrogenase complex dihydrolipoamide acyltransferase (E2) component
MPSMSMYAAEGTLVAWLRSAGARVSAGEPIVEVSTEKASFEIEAPVAGILHPIAQVGAILPVEAVMGYLLAEGEEFSPPAGREAGSETATTGQSSVSPAPRLLPPENSVGAQSAPPCPPASQIRATPIARRLAAQHGIDLGHLAGSGPGGRVVEADVLAAVTSRVGTLPGEAIADGRRILRRVPLAGMRRTIADRLRQSLTTAVPVTLTREVHADVLVAARGRLGERMERTLPWDALFIKLLATAQRQHPELNATVENDTLLVFDEVHIGFAVSVPGGLLVPVVRNADKEPLVSVADLVRDLRDRARAGKLRPADMAGGTATLSNLGAHGIDAFTPILNSTQSVILGVGRIAPRPVIRDGHVTAGHTCILSLTFDHRVTDGAPGAQLLETIARLVADDKYLMALA